MIQRFELSPNQIKVRNLLNKNFIELEIYAISDANPNRNDSHFTLESLQSGIATFTDKPILGFFNKDNDFESHNGRPAYDPELEQEYWDNKDGEQILGFIRESDSKRIEEKKGLHWIVCTAMVYTQYNYPQIKRLLKDRRKKVSVEVAIKRSESINGIEEIYEFELLGITILGSKHGVPVEEGIEGASLSVLDLAEHEVYSKQKQVLAFAYKELEKSKKEVDGLAELKVDKSKEAMSDTAWSDVDKTALRHKVVEASNFKSIADDVFLQLLDGWEDGEVSKLKYPVMQIVHGDTLVYNRGALASAKAYAEKNDEKEVLKKLSAIYKHLDLQVEHEATMDTEKTFETEQKVVESEAVETEAVAVEEVAVEEVAVKNAEEPSVNSEEGCCKDMSVEGTEGQCDDLKMDYDELNCKYETLCGEFEALQAECNGYKAKCEEYESELAACKGQMADYEEVKAALAEAQDNLCKYQIAQQMAYLNELQCSMNLSDEDVVCVKEQCEQGCFADKEEIAKEMAFIQYKKLASAKPVTQENHFAVALHNETRPTSRAKSVQERLKENLK